MKKILLVEDDQSLQEIYEVRLQHEGYHVFTAGDGEEALKVALKERPDLILSDVMMPRISGFDMLDILRSTPEIKDTKVIIMTALSSDDQRERGEALGANMYLVKSQVGIEDIIQAVKTVLADTEKPKKSAKVEADKSAEDNSASNETALIETSSIESATDETKQANDESSQTQDLEQLISQMEAATPEPPPEFSVSTDASPSVNEAENPSAVDFSIEETPNKSLIRPTEPTTEQTAAIQDPDRPIREPIPLHEIIPPRFQP